MQPSTIKNFLNEDITYSNESSTIGVYLFDTNGNSLFANEQFLEIFEYSMKEFENTSFHNFFNVEDFDSIFKQENKASASFSIKKFRYAAKNKYQQTIQLQLVSLKQVSHGNWMMKVIELSNKENRDREFFKTYLQVENLRIALNQSSTVSVTDEDGNIIYVNDKFCEVSKFSRKELYGKNHRIVKSHVHTKEHFKKLWDTITNGEIWRGEVCNRAKDGSLWWDDVTIVPFLDEKGIPYQHVAIRKEITEKKKADKQIYELAYYDYITGVPNRRKFEEDLQLAIENGKKSAQNFSLIVTKVHGLKFINESLGTVVGDKVLQEAAGRLYRLVQKKGELYRIDGNEFAIILSNQHINSEEFANIIIEEFKSTFNINKYELNTYVNIGITIFPDCGHDVHSLMRNLYHGLYLATKKGKNEYAVLSNISDGNICKELTLKNDLHKASLKDELIVYFQPRIALNSNKIVGAEALVRWMHPEFGLLSPGEFIHLAEEERVIDTIGEIVFRKACIQNKKWQEQGYAPIVVSVNFSVSQFLQSNLIDFVDKTLKEVGLDPKWIEIELTESALISDELTVSSKIEILNDMGIKTSIDDFGTGYASLSYLKNFKAKTLKIDKSFIDGITTEKVSFEIVNGIIQLAKRLNIKTVAEGVEKQKQLEALNAMNCDEIQGYLISKPLPTEDFEKVLQKSVCYPAP